MAVLSLQLNSYAEERHANLWIRQRIVGKSAVNVCGLWD